MDKLQKFYTLKQYGLPCPEIYEYNGEEIKGDNLWTVRCIVSNENKKSVIKATGIFSELAESKMKSLKNKYGDSITIFYYRYFIAVASGTLLVDKDECYAEVSKGDLWNLSDKGNINLVATLRNENVATLGDSSVMSSVQMRELFSYCENARQMTDQKAVILDWSLTDTEQILFYDFELK